MFEKDYWPRLFFGEKNGPICFIIVARLCEYIIRLLRSFCFSRSFCVLNQTMKANRYGSRGKNCHCRCCATAGRSIGGNVTDGEPKINKYKKYVYIYRERSVNISVLLLKKYKKSTTATKHWAKDELGAPLLYY